MVTPASCSSCRRADLYKDYPSDDEKEQEKEKPASSFVLVLVLFFDEALYPDS